MTLTFSRRLAIVFGVLLPVVETIRRWHQLDDLAMWPAWLDDLILGGALLFGAWYTTKSVASGRPYLIAAWGLTCGMAYGSFFGQLMRMQEQDPSGVPSEWVVGIKGIGLLLAVAALVGSLRSIPNKVVQDAAPTARA